MNEMVKITRNKNIRSMDKDVNNSLVAMWYMHSTLKKRSPETIERKVLISQLVKETSHILFNMNPDCNFNIFMARRLLSCFTSHFCCFMLGPGSYIWFGANE